MITISPSKMEAYDETNECIFTVESFDEYTVSFKLISLVGRGDIDEICDAMKRAVIEMTIELPDSTQ